MLGFTTYFEYDEVRKIDMYKIYNPEFASGFFTDKAIRRRILELVYSFWNFIVSNYCDLLCFLLLLEFLKNERMMQQNML